jgi:cobalt-zinc-cadmium efflux system outer membrane protein
LRSRAATPLAVEDHVKTAAICGGLALAVMLAGCISPRHSTQARSLAQRLEASAPAAARTRDAEPFEGQASLERTALIEAALERNPGLAAARSAWRAALARHPQAIALEDPMLDGALAPASFGSDEVDTGYRIGLSQALPFPGKRGLRGEQALAEAEVSAQEYEAERLALAAAASQLFDEYYLAARASEQNGRHLDLLGEFSQAALARYESGSASQQDVLLAETELAELLHRKIVLETSQRRTAERINTLLHRHPELPLPPPPALLAPPVDDALDAPALTERALAERPELRAARARVEARERAVALARREYFPDFTVSGAYDSIWQEDALKPMVGLAVNVPIQLGRRSGALDEANAELARARSQAQREEAEVRLSVARAVDRLRESHHLLELVSDRMLPVSRDRLAASRAAFEGGRGSFLELIDAERGLRSAELEHEVAVVTLWRRHAELGHATADYSQFGSEVTR